ncbi:hypothetical protein [Acinetobacter nematophilus]|uniref:Uncharacterized protein n=1 Tax=Acinetobacter nematophilus TaxID=2994642 RepID=A0A9X3DVJ6_9GAMM|nr:hypothetical protein [Acinetobacter nematophilus]MCX5469279.1 hypothetical protein [Acinetobacter nematophilus]
MTTFTYIGLFVFSLTSTVLWAKPCASSGGNFTNVLPVRVPITAADLVGTVVSKNTLSDMAFEKAAEITQKSFGGSVNKDQIVFQPTFILRGMPYQMNLPMHFDGQKSIGRAIQTQFMKNPPPLNPDWNCDPRENTRWEPCCQECADQGIAQWYEVKFMFNRGFILHEQEKAARKKVVRHIVYL